MNCKEWLRNNLLLMLTIVGVGAGVAIGIIARQSNPSETTVELAAFPGEIFMRMLQMAVLPLVTSSIVTGIATLDPKASRRVFILSFSYYIFTTCVAIAQAILLVVIIGPGYRTNLDDTTSNNEILPKGPQITSRDAILDLFRNIFPENIAEACVKQYKTAFVAIEGGKEDNDTFIKYEKKVIYEPQMNILGIIMISIVAGITLGKLKEIGKSLTACLSIVDHITMKLIMLLMWYSPVGIASLIIGQLLKMEDIHKTLAALAIFISTVMLGFAIQMFIMQPLLYFLFTRKNPLTYMRGLIQNGEALYEAVTAIFIAQLTGWELGPLRLIIITLSAKFIVHLVMDYADVLKNNYPSNFVATVCSIGAAAVPSSGMVTIVISMNAIGLDMTHVPMIIACDWFIDRVRTSVNVIGDAFAAGVVNHHCRKVLEQKDAVVIVSTEAITDMDDDISDTNTTPESDVKGNDESEEKNATAASSITSTM